MILELKITNDQGEVMAYATGPPWQPLAWRSPPGKPLVVDRGKDGAYLISTVTVTPTVAIDLNFNKLGAGIGTINPMQQSVSNSSNSNPIPTGAYGTVPRPTSGLGTPYSTGTQPNQLGTSNPVSGPVTGDWRPKP